MRLSRRHFLQGSGASLLALGCRSTDNAPAQAQPAPGAPPAPAPAKSGPPPHYLVMVVLRGGYDNIMSVAPPAEPDKIGDKIFLGYKADERIRGSKRIFGPLIGGLERHDADMTLIHGVRCDTVNHPDGLQMLARGHRQARSGEIAQALAQSLVGDAPLPTLDLASPDGKLVLHERARPKWAQLRAEAHKMQLDGLAANPEATKVLTAASAATANLERFLDEAKGDAAALDGKFNGFLGGHFRMAFQAIRGNWAKCITVGSRFLAFDSHSDNVRFQRDLQPATFRDLAAFIDLLKATRNAHGPLYDQTTIAVFSELGRFPRLNAQNGKDHWPENSWIMFGRGVKKGATIGALEDSGKAMAVDFKTGAPAKDNARPLFLENAFATLVKIAGGDPTKVGYVKDSVVDAVLA
jgi:uncharacterized protein (DUF1501 family)